MKKLDLHIHTIASPSDAPFSFDIRKLDDYIKSQRLNGIAITNHNIFDLQQFSQIQKATDAVVLPGIEINVEAGHLLVMLII